MYVGFHEEGDRCNQKDCEGILEYPPVENCSCHINPPCSKCVDRPLTCSMCDWEEDALDYKDISVATGLVMREFKPKPLDKSKIDWRAKLHSNSSMIKEGCYPEGTTREEVREKVKGTFGGRFESFGNGKFKFIAYTD